MTTQYVVSYTATPYNGLAEAANRCLEKFGAEWAGIGEMVGGDLHIVWEVPTENAEAARDALEGLGFQADLGGEVPEDLSVMEQARAEKAAKQEAQP